MGSQETKTGFKYNKKAYGLKVIDEHDEQNSGRARKAKLKTNSTQTLRDGFTRIDSKKIPAAIQESNAEKYSNPKRGVTSWKAPGRK